MLYEGKRGSWFSHSEEAEWHLVGHSGEEALDLIFGVKGLIYRLPMGHELTKKTLVKREVRQWLDDSCCDQLA